MFNLVTQEHGMVRETVHRLFKDLRATDTEMRQRDGSRIASAAVGSALAELGIYETDGTETFMVSAQVQAIVALEAGASALPFPVTESLAAHATLAKTDKLAEMEAGHFMTLSTASPELSELPVYVADKLTGTGQLVSYSQVTGRALIEACQASSRVALTVDLNGAGVRRCRRTSVEGEYLLDDLEFDHVPAHPLGGSGTTELDVSEFLGQRLAILAAAEIAGACRSMVEMTQEYLLTRSQFGQVLGANQVLKHALADNLVRVEAMSASIEYAAAALDAGAQDAAAAAAAAKLFAGRAGKLVADSSLQMHGAIGYTAEYQLHLLMRRVYRLAASFGSSLVQSDRLFEMFKQGSSND